MVVPAQLRHSFSHDIRNDAPIAFTTRCLRSLLILLCLSVDVYANTSAKKPNIVLIFADDMGYGDPGCYGGSLVTTPNIDSLTEPGIRFTQGYSISPVCGPSRVGLHSGMQPSRIGVCWNPDMGAVPSLILPRVAIISPAVLDRPLERDLHTARVFQPVINLTGEFADKVLVLGVLD